MKQPAIRRSIVVCSLMLSACNTAGGMGGPDASAGQNTVSGSGGESTPNGSGGTAQTAQASGSGGATGPGNPQLDAGTQSGSGGSSMSSGKPKPPPPAGSVSKPGEYSGYNDPIYEGYELSSQYVAMRDGTKLAVDLYRPKDASGAIVTTKLPVLWMHTPYNRRTFTSAAGSGVAGEYYPGAAARLIEYGYVVAIVDFRGVYASYGKNAGYNRGEWVDAAKNDAYDITEWLAAQPFSNGNIGMWGCSATGGSQLQAATTAPPHLKAIFPMSCEFDVYPFAVPGGMSPAKGDTKAPPGGLTPALRDAMAQAVDGDLGTQLRAAVGEHAGNIENPGYVPFRDSTAEKIPEKWWQKSSPHTYLEQIKQSGIAIYVAANWDEAATKYGAFFTLNNVTNPARLIVGPGAHCAWFSVQTMTGFDIAVEERRFFDYWLKGVENGVMDEPKVYYYTYNEPAGKEWRSAASWPLKEEKRTPYYLGPKTLSTTAPSAASAKQDIQVDYSVTAATLVDKGLSFETAPLAKDIRITGHPVADLWVASSATDGDFVATLQDVAADGKVASYNMHGRLRASLRKEAPAPYDNLGLPYHPSNQADAQPLVAGQPAQLRFDLLPISIVVKAGHRIRLVLTFAEAVTPKLSPAPTVSVYFDAAHPSSVTLPIVEE